MGKLTVAQLNFWLKCLSINQNGSKMELLDRCTSSSFARSISSLCCFFFYYKCTWRFRHVFSYITCFLRVKNLLTQRGASLKQSQRDNEELRKMGKPRVMQQTSSRTFPPLIQHLVITLPSFPRSFPLIH